MPKITELVPVEDWQHLIAPDTFVAVDIDTPLTGPERLVGTVTGIDGSVVWLQYPDSRNTVSIAYDAIEAVYWAPVGYRP